MERKQIEFYKNRFDDIIHEIDGVEFWYARELQRLLGYEQWRNFALILQKAETSCKAAGFNITDHFAEVSKMVPIGSGAERSIKDYMLTRYACYLIAQNGDPKKEEIAFAQSYFAVQTRKQEHRENLLQNLWFHEIHHISFKAFEPDIIVHSDK